MDNCAYNEIKVVGDREILEQFRKAVGSYGEEREVQDMDDKTKKIVRKMDKIMNVFDFDKIISHPEGFDTFADVDVKCLLIEEKTVKNIILHWWKHEYWSVKSNSRSATVTDDGIDLTYKFWTEYCYPHKIFEKIIKDWNTLEFYFSLPSKFGLYDIEAKASHGEWTYFYDYILECTGGYQGDDPEFMDRSLWYDGDYDPRFVYDGPEFEDDDPELQYVGRQFFVLYRHNLITGSFEAIRQIWLPDEGYSNIEEFV
jgi:hypothetical protein